jgi:hypothetical protein
MTGMPNLNHDVLLGMLDATLGEYETLLTQIDIDSPAPAADPWDARHVLSHVIGAMQRAPFQAGFFLTGASTVPVTFHDPYWLPEYENAPLDSFRTALKAVFEGNKAALRAIAPQDLWKSITLPQFGETPLAVFLMVAYQQHVNEQHIPQLRAFVKE